MITVFLLDLKSTYVMVLSFAIGLGWSRDHIIVNIVKPVSVHQWQYGSVDPPDS